VNGRLVEEARIENPAYDTRTAGIAWTTPEGLTRIKEVQTTDLAIRVPQRNDTTDYETIRDGGKLRPLEEIEQKVVRDALSNHGNRTFELMVLFGLETGARKQTICTLRIHHIRNLLEKSGQEGNPHEELLLKVGAGTTIDVKFKGDQKQFRLHIPKWIAQSLISYADSNEARKRRERSFYGDCDENYLFLNERGGPYFTSEIEIRDRQDLKFSSRISYEDRVDFPIAEGRSLNALLRRLITSIQSEYPEFEPFRIHDLRATYGRNYINRRLEHGASESEAIDELKKRLGHSQRSTTQGYLEYKADTAKVKALEAKISDRHTIHKRKDLS
jgi:integrase